MLYTKLVAARLRYLLQQLIALLQEKKQVCTLLVLPAFGNEMDQVFPEIWILIPIIETGTYHLLACLLTYLLTYLLAVDFCIRHMRTYFMSFKDML